VRNNQKAVTWILVCVVWLTTGFPAAALPIQRDRQITSGQKPAVAQPSPSPGPIPAPTAEPSPSASAVQPKVSQPTTTLTELQSRIAEILAKPELSSAMIGVKVASLDTGRVLFEENATKLMRPASHMKLYTIAAAIGFHLTIASLPPFMR
jgi:D-alanyl-D-alanine carboxypeptidase